MGRGGCGISGEGKESAELHLSRPANKTDLDSLVKLQLRVCVKVSLLLKNHNDVNASEKFRIRFVLLHR